MNFRKYYQNFFVTRATFFSGWRGIVIIIFFLIIVKGTTDEILNQGMHLDEAIGIFGVAILLTYLYYRLWLEQQKHTDFLALLLQERNTLRNGGSINYEQTQIVLMSKVVCFRGVFSIFIFTSSLPSRYLVPDKDSIARWGILYCLISLLLGWWGLPWGPIKTIQALAVGLKGGQRQTIREVIEELEHKLKIIN